MGRVRTNNLKEAGKSEELSDDIKSKYKEKFPEVQTAKYKCK